MLDTLEQVVADQVTGGRFEREAGAQVRRLDVGTVPGLLHPRPRRVIRPAPALFSVEGVTERVECLLPVRRRDVEAPAGLQVASRGEDMHVGAAALAVHHGRPGVAVGLEPRPGWSIYEVSDYLGCGSYGSRVVPRRQGRARPFVAASGPCSGHHAWTVRGLPGSPASHPVAMRTFSDPGRPVAPRL